MDPGQLIDELQGVVVDCEGTVVGVADPGEPAPVKHDVRNSPGDRIARILVRDADLGNHIQTAGAQGAERVEETRVAETGVVDEVGS